MIQIRFVNVKLLLFLFLFLFFIIDVVLSNMTSNLKLRSNAKFHTVIYSEYCSESGSTYFQDGINNTLVFTQCQHWYRLVWTIYLTNIKKNMYRSQNGSITHCSIVQSRSHDDVIADRTSSLSMCVLLNIWTSTRIINNKNLFRFLRFPTNIYLRFVISLIYICNLSIHTCADTWLKQI